MTKPQLLADAKKHGVFPSPGAVQQSKADLIGLILAKLQADNASANAAIAKDLMGDSGHAVLLARLEARLKSSVVLVVAVTEGTSSGSPLAAAPEGSKARDDQPTLSVKSKLRFHNVRFYSTRAPWVSPCGAVRGCAGPCRPCGAVWGRAGPCLAS